MRKVFLVLVALIFVLGTIGSAWAKELNIAFADKMKILFEYSKTKKLNQDLEDESQKARETVEKMSEEVKKLSDEIELLSESAKKEKQPALDAKIQALNDFKKDKMQEIGKKQDEGVRGITKEIADACEKYAKAKGYDAIIDVRATLFAPTSLDITEALLKEINQPAEPEKKK